MLRIFYCFLLTFLSTGLFAQYDEITMEDYVYVTNVKSVALSPIGNTLEPAVTYLNGATLVLTFDDMDADQKDFTYDIIHCDRNWKPSDLQKQEYIDGFVNEEVDNWRFSQGTYVPYTSYTLNIPNRDLSITLSGNYVLVVYEGEEDEDRIPIITRRFVVVDDQVTIETKPRTSFEASKISTHQVFDLSLNIEELNIVEPLQTLSVSINQNGNWNNAITDVRPKFPMGDRLMIDNTGKISFPGLKEFRSLDIRSFDIVSMDVHTLKLTDNGTDILVKLGQPRTFGGYRNYPDADGAFILANRDGVDIMQSDYANVIFTLETAERDEDVYVTGKFTDWVADDMYKMTYDPDRGIYVAEVELKQGFYDYYFAVLNDEGLLDPTPFEGSSFETDNFYQIFVYLREPGDRYDRVVGYKKLLFERL